MALVSLTSLVSLVSLSRAQMKMRALGVCVYASQSLMKDTVLEREPWGLWGPFAEAQVQNQIRAFVAQAFASGPWVRVGAQVQNQIQAFAGLWVAFAGLWVQAFAEIRLQVRL